MAKLLLVVIALLVAPLPTLAASDIIGRASVIDGDTIEVHGQRIRLHGIDAPEADQTCRVNGTIVRCGQQAAISLDTKIGNKVVTCEPRDRDRYDRIVAVCQAGGEDLNAWMVAVGMALAYRQYSSDYVPQEKTAAAHKRGMWAGEFTPPWEYRAAQRKVEEAQRKKQDPKGQCVIKGNISTRTGEKIYHVPGGRYYNATKIDTSKGERWFCSETQARLAGWRRSKR